MITIEQGLQAYRIYAQAAGRSPRTIEWVTRSMHHFIEFLGNGKRYCSQITANDLRRFIIEYSKQHKYEHHPFNSEQDEIVSPVSVQTYVRGIKAFFGYLATDELIPTNVMLKVKTPRVPVMAVPTFTENEIERLLKAPDRQSMTGFRDYALILTFIDTNARLSELCNLNEKDVDIENGYLRLMGKGSKERFTPIGSKVCRTLLKYKLKYRPQPIGTEAFWLTENGDRLTANQGDKINF